MNCITCGTSLVLENKTFIYVEFGGRGRKTEKGEYCQSCVDKQLEPYKQKRQSESLFPDYRGEK